MARKKKENETSAPETAAAQDQEAPQAAQSEGTPEQASPSATEEAIEAARAEASRNWDLYLRTQADLENYRKRAQREKEDLSKFANETILREILPVVDNLERALQHAGKSEEAGGGLLQGVEMTLGQFRKVLEKFGVTTIEAVGEPFDPARHEAMGQVETQEVPPNAVVQVMQKGYLLNERLLRPSLVLIAKAPAASTSE